MAEILARLPSRAIEGVFLRAESYDEATRTIDLVWSTGATVRRYVITQACDGGV